MSILYTLISLWLMSFFVSTSVAADERLRADDHAPIGVMADHYHEVGEFMFSYRYMSMSMRDNLIGNDSVSPSTIATTTQNRFFGQPMQPPTLRVVPTEMTMKMHMLGLMYAPTSSLTLMAMLNQTSKNMDHVTFQGMKGEQQLGTFTTSTSGLGDTSLSALVRISETETSRLHATLGVSLPTGDTDATGAVLAPTGMRPTLRLPYPMQLGSGTNDLIGGLTYSRFHERWSWGSQWRSIVRTGNNDEGYTLGDEHRLTTWYSYLLSAGVSWSARLEYFERGNIDGIDPLIKAPVQTADPSHQGATRLDAALGINFANEGGHRLALEFVVPLEQDLEGPQLGTSSQLILGYQYVF